MVQINVSNGQGITQAIKAKVQADGGTISNNTLSVWQQVMTEVKTAQESGSQIYTGGDEIEKLNDSANWKTDFKVMTNQVIELAQDVWNKIVQLLTGQAAQPETVAEQPVVEQVVQEVVEESRDEIEVETPSEEVEHTSNDAVSVTGSSQTLSKEQADALVQETLGKPLPDGVEVSFVMSNGTIVPTFKKDGQPISPDSLKEPATVVVANEPETPLVTGPPRGENPEYDAIVNPQPVEPIIKDGYIRNISDVLIGLDGVQRVIRAEFGITVTREDGETLEIGNTQAELDRAKAFIRGEEVLPVETVDDVQDIDEVEEVDNAGQTENTNEPYTIGNVQFTENGYSMKTNVPADDEAENIQNFLGRSNINVYRTPDGRINYRGHIDLSESIARTHAETSMRVLCRQKGTYLQLLEKDYNTLPAGEKAFVDEFNRLMTDMEIKIDGSDNFVNIEGSQYVK